MRREKMIAYRRSKVGELLAFGKSQAEIADVLRVSRPVISRDVAFIEGEARQRLSDHVRKSVPHVHLICMRGLNEIIKRCWAIADNAKNDYLRIHALTLLNAVYLAKQTLSTDGTILNQSLELIEKSKDKLKALEQGKVRPLKKLIESSATVDGNVSQTDGNQTMVTVSGEVAEATDQDPDQPVDEDQPEESKDYDRTRSEDMAATDEETSEDKKDV